MPYMPWLHYCCVCGIFLGPDNGDGICRACGRDSVEATEEETPTQED